MLEEALSLLFKFMNSDDSDVSMAIFGFASSYLNSVDLS
jgi:hypothetical protein